MAGIENPYTGGVVLWSEDRGEPSGEQQLAAYIEQRFRNRHQFLAHHQALEATASRLAADKRLDLSKGEAGLDTFLDEVAAELTKPGQNGRTGLLAEIYEAQKAMGLVD